MEIIDISKKIEEYWYNQRWKRFLRKEKRALRRLEARIENLEIRANKLFEK